MNEIKAKSSLAGKLKLTRPLSFIDLESTGLDVENDRIIEITICKVHPDGSKEIKTKRFNPEIAIAPDAFDKHGITDEELKSEPTFKKLAKGILAFIADTDIAGFNTNVFDMPLLYNEFLRAGAKFDYSKVRFIDMCNIFHIKESRDLKGAYKFYCKKDFDNHHDSASDTLATIEVFEGQLEMYDDLPTDLDSLSKFSNFDKTMLDIGGKFVLDADGDVVLNFGKHKHHKAKSEKNFLEWMVSGKATFSEDVKEIANKLLEEIKEGK